MVAPLVPRKIKIKKVKTSKLRHQEVLLPNKVIFIGETIKGAITGSGQLFFQDNSKYTGAVRKGRPHGQGCKQWPVDDRFTKQYRGTWVKGRMEGYGELTLMPGEVYIGNFKNGSPQG